MTIVQNEEQLLTAMKNKASEIQILGGYADNIKPAIEKAYTAKTVSKKLIASPVTGPFPILETFKDIMQTKDALMGHYKIVKSDNGLLLLRRVLD